MHFRVITFALVINVFAIFPAFAHHAATATFDVNQTAEIEGVVTKFAFKNPHVAIYLMVTDEDGNEKEWMATAPAVSPFRNWGWSATTVEEGQYLKLVGRKARGDASMILMERDDIEGGKLFELNPEDGSVIRVLGGVDAAPTAEPTLLERPQLELSDGRPNVTGTWVSGGGGPPPRPPAGETAAPRPAPPGGGRNSAPLNAAGLALQEAWDPTQDPAFVDCLPRSVHRVLLDRHALKLTQGEDHVLVELEGDGSRRHIPINAPADVTAEHSVVGSSVARYEGDTLVIETNQMLGGPSSQGGNILSDQMTMVERYRRADNDQGAGLELSITLNDPTYLAAPWQTAQNRVLASDYPFAETECQMPLLTN